jgi:hypothetical protein
VSEAAAKALVNRLSPSSKELPDSVKSYLEAGDPIRVYSLILESKNLHLESTFEPVKGQQVRNKNGMRGPQYALGPLTTHQLEKQHRAAEVITACPER